MPVSRVNALLTQEASEAVVTLILAVSIPAATEPTFLTVALLMAARAESILWTVCGKKTAEYPREQGQFAGS